MPRAYAVRVGAPAGYLDLPRVPWEGGPSYYAKFPVTAGTEWVTDDFFPIMYWGMFVDSQTRINNNASLGINSAPSVFNATANSAGWMADAGIWNLGGNAGGITGTSHVGVNIGDEQDMWGQDGWSAWTGNYPGDGPICDPVESRCGFTICYEIESALPADGRLRYWNGGKGLSQWWTDAGAATFVNGGDPAVHTWNVDICSLDHYLYTDYYLSGGEFGISSIPEIRRAANYGEILMTRIRYLDGLAGKRKPVGVVVEMGGQSDIDPNLEMTPDKIEGAVWSTIVHEARFVIYFSHAFGNQRTSDALNDTATYYQSVQARVGTINSQVAGLARVLNTQSYVWEFNPNVATMLKVRDNYAYIFAMQKRASGSSGTFSFTLPPGVHGTSVEVLHESRTLPVTAGAFTDSFAAEYSHHIYKIATA